MEVHFILLPLMFSWRKWHCSPLLRCLATNKRERKLDRRDPLEEIGPIRRQQLGRSMWSRNVQLCEICLLSDIRAEDKKHRISIIEPLWTSWRESSQLNEPPSAMSGIFFPFNADGDFNETFFCPLIAFDLIANSPCEVGLIRFYISRVQFSNLYSAVAVKDFS